MAKQTYEYVYAKDVFDDNNEGLLYGIEDTTDFPEYIEWFESIKKLEAHRKKNKLKVINREQFLKRFKGKKGD